VVATHQARKAMSKGVVPVMLRSQSPPATPFGEPTPRTAHRPSILDARLGIDRDAALLSDGELADLLGDSARMARLARRKVS
jgi:hypothetical protein